MVQVEIHEDGGRVYYVNKATGETSWAPFKEGDEGTMLHQLRELKALRDNGDLTEVEFAQMKAQLVELSAHNTGGGGEYTGDGESHEAARALQTAQRGAKIRKETSKIMGEFKQRRKTLVLDLEVESGQVKTRLQQRLEARQKKKEVAEAKKTARAKGKAMKLAAKQAAKAA